MKFSSTTRSAFSAVLFLIGSSWYASATTIITGALKPPDCRSNGQIDPLSTERDFPVHDAIAQYLTLGESSRHVFRCVGSGFRYEGITEPNRVIVRSFHAANRKLHAELTYLSASEGNGYSRNGEVVVKGLGGSVQAVHYYCDGLPMGLHRFLDAKGKLAFVVDYTKSDYRLFRFLQPTRTFASNGQTLGSVSNNYQRATNFREVYQFVKGRWSRVGLAVSAYPHGDWEPVDNNSSIADWVSPGQTAVISIENTKLQIHNNTWSYLSFASYTGVLDWVRPFPRSLTIRTTRSFRVPR